MYQFREYYIPERMMGGIERYVMHGILPGDFLQAVLSNDLMLTYGTADEENMKNIPAYLAFLYNNTPSNCWGSKEIMLDYVNMRQEKAKEEEVKKEMLEEEREDYGID